MPNPKRPAAAAPQNEANAARSELIVIAKPHLGLRANREGIASAMGADVSALGKLLSSADIALEPLFGIAEDRMVARAAAMSADALAEVPDLSLFYRVEAQGKDLDSLAKQLRDVEGIEAAYVKPPAEPAVIRVNDMEARAETPPAVTPDFTGRQSYLDPAQVGIDARYAWTLPGGSGAGVKVIDIEWGWRFAHEDLIQNQGGVVSGTNSTDDNHGTAVLGEISGDRNSFGVTGIAPDAVISAVSLVTHSTSQAIRIAADRLSAGDIILLEVHRGGPRSSATTGQFGYIGIEWWPDDFAAIRYAVSKGIIVVEAAGNGGQNLDDAIYNTRPAGFPATWTNPFNPANPSSEAVLVGAGMPPPGTHGRTFHPGWGDVYADRARCYFSNYGARVDAQGWGWEVTTTGYGDLQGGSDRNAWYTDQFSGTSSASPIVVGALACLQGALRAHGRPVLTAATAISLLRGTGSPQTDGPAFTFLPNMAGSGYPQNHPARPRTQRIGNRPDLRAMLGAVLIAPTPTRVPLYRYWNPTATDHFYTTNWAELGSGRYGWNFEQVQCFVYPTAAAGAVPLHRYWNAGIGDHFYTTNWSELGNGAHGWGYEGVQCYVLPAAAPGSIPLYRYWNQSAGDHFYTTNWSELGTGRYGWGYEGIQCYVFATAASPDAGSEASAADSSRHTPPSFTLSAAGDPEPAPPATFAVPHAAAAGAADQTASITSFELKERGGRR